MMRYAALHQPHDPLPVRLITDLPPMAVLRRWTATKKTFLQRGCCREPRAA